MISINIIIRLKNTQAVSKLTVTHPPSIQSFILSIVVLFELKISVYNL